MAVPKKNKIIFRADGSTLTGYGHVMRLLSLAGFLNKKYRCEFMIRRPDAFLKAQILSVCDSVVELPLTGNLAKEAQEVASRAAPSDIFILDGYDFTTRYQSAVKKKCFRLICIDDIYNRHFVADVVINHSEGIKEASYSKEKYTQLCLGSGYAILRRSFLNNLRTSKPLPAEKLRIFINMGGTDQENHSSRALKACLKLKSISSIDIVLGSFFAYTDELKSLIEKNNHIKIVLHSNLGEKEMCTLMKRSHAAICSASTVSYEYASVGGILFVYKTAGNQKNIHSFLLRSHIAFPVNQLEEKLNLFGDPGHCRAYFENRSLYFTGQSDKNIAAIFDRFEKEREISIRTANINDLPVYYKWVNEKEVRRNSVNQSDIDLASHKKWFEARLKNKNAVLYYFEKNGIPIGQVRFDKENDHAEIDYSIDSKFRGKGYGTIILMRAASAYMQKHPGIKIIAKVKESNAASNKVFIKTGFKALKSFTLHNAVYCKYVLPPAK